MALVATGAKALVGFDDGLNGFTPIAFAGSISISHENRLEEIPQLDDVVIAEYAENGHRCSFSVSLFKLIGVDSTTYSFDASRLETLLIQPELEFQVISQESQNPDDPPVVLYSMTGVKFKGGSGQMDARGVWTGQWDFVARRGVGI